MASAYICIALICRVRRRQCRSGVASGDLHWLRWRCVLSACNHNCDYIFVLFVLAFGSRHRIKRATTMTTRAVYCAFASRLTPT